MSAPVSQPLEESNGAPSQPPLQQPPQQPLPPPPATTLHHDIINRILATPFSTITPFGSSQAFFAFFRFSFSHSWFFLLLHSFGGCSWLVTGHTEPEAL